MTINLDQFDTRVPAGGIEIEFRGEKFRVRKSTVSDAYNETRLGDINTEEELKEHLKTVLFEDQREFRRFWKTVTESYETETGSYGPLSYGELIRLATKMGSAANGILSATGDEDPKERESSEDS